MYLHLTKPLKNPGAANRLHQNHLKKKKKKYNISEWVAASCYLQKRFFSSSPFLFFCEL